ncbi:hypothetical protein G6539_02925 [Streptomyces albidoflavus]|nr:hypothetical protein [Streptomyces albidoflavus]MBL0799613.1 hypothetical protein [Streptomyces albidoflavus]
MLRSSSGCTNCPVAPGWCRHRSGHVHPLSAGTGMNAIRPASPVSRVTPSGQLRCPVDPTGTRKYTARLPLTSSTTGPGSPKVIWAIASAISRPAHPSTRTASNRTPALRSWTPQEGTQSSSVA